MNNILSVSMANNNVNFYNYQTNKKSFNTSFKGGNDSVNIVRKTILKNKKSFLQKIMDSLGLNRLNNITDNEIFALRQSLKTLSNESEYKAYGEKITNNIIKNLDKYSKNEESAQFVKECLQFIKDNQNRVLYSNTGGAASCGFNFGKNGEKILKAMQLALVDAFIPNKYEKQMVDESIKIARNAMKM